MNKGSVFLPRVMWAKIRVLDLVMNEGQLRGTCWGG